MTDLIIEKFTGRARLRDDQTDEELLFENLCRTDQVMHFFEHELEAFRSHVSPALKELGLQDSSNLDEHRRNYLASLDRIDAIDAHISKLVEDFCLVRDEWIAAAEVDQPNIMERLLKCRNGIEKLLSDREHADTSHQDLLGTIRPLISRIKLAKLLATEMDSKSVSRESDLAVSVGDFESSSKNLVRRLSVEESKMTQLSASEYHSLATAIRAPEFPQLFTSYLDEISDANNKKELIDYMKCLEAQGDVPRGKRLVRPTFWLTLESRFRNHPKQSPVLIHIASSEFFEGASINSVTHEVRIPFVTSPTRIEKMGEGSKPCICIDVLVGNETVDEFDKRGNSFLVILSDMIIEHLNDKCFQRDKLSKDIKRRSSACSVEVIPFLLDASGEQSTPQPNPPAVTTPSECEPLAEGNAINVASYRVTYIYGTSELSFDDCSRSKPEGLRIRVILPGILDSSQVQIETSTELLVTAGNHQICVPVGIPVDMKAGKAEFDKASSTLTITFPL